MLLEISEHIRLKENHPQLPNFIFHKDNVILSQQIRLDEIHMKELLIFLDHYSEDFILSTLKVCVVEFEDILLQY